MRNKKWLFCIIVLMLIVASISVVLIGCVKPVEPDKPVPLPPPDPDDETEVYAPTVSGSELFEKIGKGITSPDTVSHISFYADIELAGNEVVVPGETLPGKGIYRLDFFLNLGELKNNEMSLVLKKLGKKTAEAANASNKTQTKSDNKNLFENKLDNYNLDLATSDEDEVVFAVYGVNGGIFLNPGGGAAMIHLSDFNMDYIINIIKQAVSTLGGALGGILNDPTIKNIIPLVLQMVFPDPAAEVIEGDFTTYTLGVALNSFLDTLSSLLGDIDLGSIIPSFPTLGFSLGAVVRHIVSFIPQIDIKLKTYFRGDAFEKIELIVNSESDTGVAGSQLIKVGGGINITDTPVTIDIPDIKDYKEFSFTNFNFDFDLKLESTDVNGNPAKFDIGKLMSMMLTQTSGKPLLPSGILMLDLNTGFRLSVDVDLDLNYEKQTSGDKNLIAFELFILKADGTPEETPALGFYYQNKSAYLNLGNIAPNYYKGRSIKVDVSIPEIIDNAVQLIFDAIDKGLGTNSDGIFGHVSATKENGAQVKALFDDAKNKNKIVNLALSETQAPVLSFGMQSFINGLFGILFSDKNQQFIVATDNSIKITVNNDFFKAVEQMIGISFMPFKLPDYVGDIVLSANFAAGKPLDSIAITGSVVNKGTAIDGKDNQYIGAELKLHNINIGFAEESLREHITKAIGDVLTYDDDIQNLLYNILGTSDTNNNGGGSSIQAGIEVNVKAGKYNFGQLLAGLGMTFMKVYPDDPTSTEYKEAIWEIKQDMLLELAFKAEIKLDSVTKNKSQAVLEIVSNKGFVFGDGSGANGNDTVIAPGTVLIGIYCFQGEMFVDLSGLKIANITLPKIKIQNVDMGTFIYDFIGDINFNLTDKIAELLAGMGLLTGKGEKSTKSGSDMDGALGLTTGSLFTPKEGAQAGVDNNGNYSYKAQDLNLSSLGQILVGINSDSIGAQITLAAIFKLLEHFGIEVPIVGGLGLELGGEIKLDRMEGFTLDFLGSIAPRWQEASVDEAGNPIPAGYYHGDNVRVLMSIGVPDKKDANGAVIPGSGYPMSIGRLEKPYDMAKKATEFERYEADLVKALVDTLGKTTIEADISIDSLTADLNLQKIINAIMAANGASFPIPISLKFDKGVTMAKFTAKVNLDLESAKNTQAEVKISYMTKDERGDSFEKVLLSVALYKGDIIVDMRGLGLVQFKLVNTPIAEIVLNLINGLVDSFGEINLSKLLFDAMGNETLGDLIGEKGKTVKAEPAAEEGATGGGILDGLDPTVQDLLKYVIQSMSFNNAKVGVKVASDTISAIFSSLLGSDLGYSAKLDADLDIFSGKINLGVTFDDSVEFKVEGQLISGTDFDLGIETSQIVAWDGETGRNFVLSMLQNLDIFFTLDWKGDTPGNREWGKGQTTQYTRLTIEKLRSPRQLTNTGKNPIIDQGNILVSLMFNNKDNYLDTSQGSYETFLYIVIAPAQTSNQMRIILCNGFLKLIGIVDLSSFIDLPFSLDLVALLGDLLQDGLFSKLDRLEADIDAGENISVLSNQDMASQKSNQNQEAEYLPAKTFADLTKGLDFVKLLSRKIIEGGQVVEDKGISVNISASGTVDIGVALNPYMLNRLIDNVMGLIFGNNSQIDLSSLRVAGTSGENTQLFTTNYLTWINWSAYDQFTFWSTFNGAMFNRGGLLVTHKGILVDVVYNLVFKINAGLLSGELNRVCGIIGSIISRLLPLPVISHADIGVKLVDGTLANMSVSLVDKMDKWNGSRYEGYDIHVDNDDNNPIMRGRKNNNSTADQGTWAYKKERWDSDVYAKGGKWGSGYDYETSKSDNNPYNQTNGKTEAGTYITIINGSNSVGDPSINGTKGVISWGMPTGLVYEPYQYKDKTAGLISTVNDNLVGKTVMYQQAQNLFRTDPTTEGNISIVSRTYMVDGAPKTVYFNADGSETATPNNTGTPYSAGKIKDDVDSTYTLKVAVSFKSLPAGSQEKSRLVDLEIMATGIVANTTHTGVVGTNGGSTVITKDITTQLEEISIYAYDSLPSHVYLLLANGQKRKLAVGNFTVGDYTEKSGGNVTFKTPWEPKAENGVKAYEAQTRYASLTLQNDTTKVYNLKINYKNSTIDRSIKGKTVEIDLHQTNLTGLGMKDADGTIQGELTAEQKAALLDSFTGESTGIFYYRYVSKPGESSKVGFLPGDWIDADITALKTMLFDKEGYTTLADKLLKGDHQEVRVTVGDPKKGLQQTIVTKYVIKTKEIQSISMNGNPTVRVDPYQYYLYVTNKAKFDKAKTNETYVKWLADIDVIKKSINANQKKLDVLKNYLDTAKIGEDFTTIGATDPTTKDNGNDNNNGKIAQEDLSYWRAAKAPLESALITDNRALEKANDEFAKFMKTFTAYNEALALMTQYEPFPNYVQVNFGAGGTGDEFASYSENVYVTWGDGTDKGLLDGTYKWDTEVGAVDTTINLDASKYPNSSIAWEHNTTVKVNRNEIDRIFFDKDLTQSVLKINPFVYQNNASVGKDNFPRTAFVRMENGAVFELPVAFDTEAFTYMPKYAMESKVFRMTIGFDQSAYVYGSDKNTNVVEDPIMKGIMQHYQVTLVVEDKKAEGILIAGSELSNKGIVNEEEKSVFKIDPVQFLFSSKESTTESGGLFRALPRRVLVRYTDGTEALMDVQAWSVEGGIDQIKLDGSGKFKATCTLAKAVTELGASAVEFTIDVQVIDMSNFEFAGNKYIVEVYDNGVIVQYANLSRADVDALLGGKYIPNGGSVAVPKPEETKVFTQLDVDAFDFKLAAEGNRVYSVFANKLSFKTFVGRYDVEISYRLNPGMGETLKLKKICESLAEAEKLIAQYTKDYSEIRNSNGEVTGTDEAFKASMTENYSVYELDTKWDLSEVGYATAGIYSAKAILQGNDGALNEDGDFSNKFGKPMSVNFKVNVVNHQEKNNIRAGAKGSVYYMDDSQDNYYDSNTIYMKDGIQVYFQDKVIDKNFKEILSEISYKLPIKIDMAGVNGKGYFTAVQEHESRFGVERTFIPLLYDLPEGNPARKCLTYDFGKDVALAYEDGGLIYLFKQNATDTDYKTDTPLKGLYTRAGTTPIQEGVIDAEGNPVYVKEIVDGVERNKQATDKDGKLLYEKKFENGKWVDDLSKPIYIQVMQDANITLFNSSIIRTIKVMPGTDIERVGTIHIHIYKK